MINKNNTKNKRVHLNAFSPESEGPSINCNEEMLGEINKGRFVKSTS